MSQHDHALKGETPMTSISPSAGVLPQQQVQQPTMPSSCPHAASTPSQAVGIAPTTTDASLGGGAVQAAQGALMASPEQLVPVLQNLVDVVQRLIVVLQQQQTVSGGGAGSTGGCGMSACTMEHAAAPAGAMGAPKAAANPSVNPPSTSSGDDRSAPAPAPAASGAGTVDPSTVKDKTGTSGLKSQSIKGLDVAHRFGLPLVSGHRSGGASTSDHPKGLAIDVSTLPIGSPSSTGGTPQMKAYAEHMRQEGKAGRLDVEYVIHDGRIASSRENWEWRPYTYPGKTASSLESLKQSNRGEYNRIQHYDHVHVSFH
jgi:hypothetical protein